MPNSKLAIIRVDASTTIGIGHVMRMMALAQALIKSGWQVQFCYLECPQNLVERIALTSAITKALSAEQNRAENLAKLADEQDAALIVLDGYQFDEEYMSGLAKSKAKLLVMDDYQHCQKYHADFIVNQNIGAESMSYNTDSPEKTRLMLGKDYILLRQEFIEARAKIAPSPSRGQLHIVITLGGSDKENASLTVLKAVAGAIKNTNKTVSRVTLVCGSANPNLNSLKNQIALLNSANLSACQFLLLKDVNTMADLLSTADLVISAGGGTVWETACLGKANMVLIIAENQMGILRFAESNAVAILGTLEAMNIDSLSEKISTFLNSEQLSLMPDIARKLVDGSGAMRIVKTIESNL
jgi:UDP-2,4-diacetamido-2,4,6-trideoxy-beta-L-altropyranose hydrolase